jgi:lysozyme family protein
MKQLSSFLWGMIVGAAFAVLFVCAPKKVSIPSTYDIQQELKDAGYYSGNVDGRIGKETIQAWGKYECDVEYEKAVRK